MRRPPARLRTRIYFAAVTAEEQGLLGSQYLGAHPPDPRRPDHPRPELRHAHAHRHSHRGEVAGAERTTFYPVVEQTAKAFDFTLQPDQTRAQATTTAPITSALRASAFLRSPSARARSSKAIRRSGALRSRRLRDPPLPSAVR